MAKHQLTTRPSQAVYESLVNTLDAIIWEADAHTLEHHFISPQVKDILGYLPEQWLADASFWQAHLHPDDRQWVEETCCLKTAEKQPFQLEYRMKTEDGRYIWLRDNIVVIEAEGQPHLLRGVKIDVTKQKQMDEVERERSEVLRWLIRIVSATLDYQEILRQSLQQLKRVLTFDTASIYLNPGNTQPEFVAGIGYQDIEMTNTEAKQLLKHSPILAQMAQDLKPIISHDVRYLDGWIWVPGAEHVRSFMAVPLISPDKEMFGVFMVDNSQVGFFNEHDLQMVEALAQHISIAIENAWLLETAQKELTEKTALLRAGTAVSSTLDLQTILQRMAEVIGQAISVTSAYISDWNPETGASTVMAEYYSPAASVQECVSDLGVTYNLFDDFADNSDWLHTYQAHIEHIDDAELPLKEKEHMFLYGAKSILYVPLIVKDNVIGYAELWESRYRREFTDLEITICQGIAQQAAIAMSNAQLYEIEAKRRREAEILKELTGYLTSTLELDEVLRRVIDSVHRHLTDIHNCSISLLENDRQVLRAYVTWFKNPQYNIVPMGEGVQVADTYGARMALDTLEPFMVVDLKRSLPQDERAAQIIEKGLRAILYVPLLVHNDAIGLLHVNVWHEPRYFQPEEVAFCQSVANQAAIAIENAHLFAAERQQLQLAQTLQEVGALLTARLSLTEVYEQIFDLLARVVAYDSVSLQLLTDDGRYLYLAAARGFADLAQLREFVNGPAERFMPKVSTPPYWAVISDTHADGRWVFAHNDLDYIRSWIGAALMVKERAIGILNVDSTIPYLYNQQMGETIAAFANQAAVAIENARLYDQTSQSAKELAVLHQVAMSTAALVDIDELLQQTTTLIAINLYPDVFGFVLIDEESGELTPHPSYHGISQAVIEHPIPAEQSIVGRVVLTGEPYLTGDVTQDPYYFEGVTVTRSELAVPLQVYGQVIGAINVESPHRNAFTANDVRFLSTLASQVVTTIERAKLYKTLQDQADILARQVAERTAELQAERDRTLAILESAGEGITLTDTKATILYANPAMVQQSGYSREELIHQNTAIWQSGQTPRRVYDEMWHTILNGQRWSGEMINRRKDGTLYDVALTISPTIDASGKVIGFVGVQSDISRLKELDRLKSQFVSTVSHELRTPLTNIKMYVTLLKRGKAEKQAHYLEVLNYETDRLARLIQDLLDLSRLETEAMPEYTAATHVSEMITKIIDSFVPSAEKKHIILRQEIDARLPLVVIAGKHLAQLLTNLVGNAVAYTPEAGWVAIYAGADEQREGRMVWIRVSNSGPGIPPEEKAQLFDRFFRGRASLELGIPGTGLGLAICKEIVERYGGRIQVESEAGQGTHFTIWLPAAGDVLPGGVSQL